VLLAAIDGDLEVAILDEEDFFPRMAVDGVGLSKTWRTWPAAVGFGTSESQSTKVVARMVDCLGGA